MNAYSYEQLFQTMRMLRLTYPEAEQMFRRMVFNVLAKNCDDHTKNFAFILKKGEKWALAPAYDLCYAFDPTNVWVNQQTLSVNGKRNGFSKQDLLAVAEQMNIKKPLQIIEQIQDVIGDWPRFADQSGVSKTKAEAIQKTLPKV